MTNSLRLRLTLSCALAIAMLLAILGCTLYFSLSEAFLSRFELSLRSRAAVLISFLDWNRRGTVHFNGGADAHGLHTALAIPRRYEIWTLHGRPLLVAPDLKNYPMIFTHSLNMAGQFIRLNLANRQPALEFIVSAVRGDEDDGDGQDHKHDHHDGHQDGHKDKPRRVGDPKQATRKGRHAAKENRPDNPKRRHFILAVARSTGELDASLDSLQWSLIIACSTATIVSAFIIWWLLGRGLRPVGRIAEEITRVGADDLSDRISNDHVPIELIPIVDRLNQLLGRIDDAMRREKAMTADIAHELRTPLASMRASAELALTRPREPEEYQRIIGEFLAVELQMQHMVENFLTLARLEARPSAASEQHQCNVAKMIRRCIEESQPLLKIRNIHLESDLIDSPAINVPEELLRIVLRNVFENAIHYVDANGSIRTNIRWQPPYAIFEIANSGCRITKDQAQMVFDRFWRGDTARAELTEHSGLGLSIVRQAVNNFGGKVEVEAELDGWFVLRLYLPIDPLNS
jgi:signal transduction histidine kinase